MIWLIYAIIASVILFFLIANYTMLLHPRTRHNPNIEDYACMNDVWQKTPGNKKLVIFLHGIYCSPNMFRFIAESLEDSEWDMYMPALPTCSRTLEDLIKCGPWSWDESLAVAMEKVKSQEDKYETIVLGGHSQGGALALALGPKLHFLKALIVIAGPVNLYGPRMTFLHNAGIALAGFLHFIVKIGVKMQSRHTTERRKVKDVSSIEDLVYPLTLQAFKRIRPDVYFAVIPGLPLTLYTFKRGLVHVRGHLNEIKVPIFLAYEKSDQLVDFANYEYVRANVSSEFIYDKIFSTPQNQKSYGNRHLLPVYKPVKKELIASIKEFLSQL